jgi:hypothetical protein
MGECSEEESVRLSLVYELRRKIFHRWADSGRMASNSERISSSSADGSSSVAAICY